MANQAVQTPPSASSQSISPTSAPQLHATLINATYRQLEDLQEEWNFFARQLTQREPFYLPYWFQAFARTVARDESIPLVTVRDRGRLCGVLPLRRTGRFLRKIPARVLSSLSNVHSCRFDFVCDPNHTEAIAQAAWHALKDDSRWSVIEVNAIPEGGAFESIMRCAEQDGYFVSRWPTLLSPYLNMPTDPSDPFRNCPQHYKKDRKRLEKRFERLEEFGEPTFEVHTHFSEDLFNEFLEIESSGWKGHAGGAIKCSPVLIDFYRQLLSAAAQEGHVRMCALRVGGKAVAMEISFVVDDKCYSPKIAYDEAFSSASPGQQLARFSIQDLAHRGISKYDLLGPRSRHKAIWAGDVRPHANCYIFRPSLAGKMYYYIIDKVGPRVKRAKYARHGDPQKL